MVQLWATRAAIEEARSKRKGFRSTYDGREVRKHLVHHTKRDCEAALRDYVKDGELIKFNSGVVSDQGMKLFKYCLYCLPPDRVICPRCKGKRNFEEFEHRASGMCYGCYGEGSVEKSRAASVKSVPASSNRKNHTPEEVLALLDGGPVKQASSSSSGRSSGRKASANSNSNRRKKPEPPKKTSLIGDIFRAIFSSPAEPAQARPGNAGEPWTAEEELKLRQRHCEGMGIAEIAEEHERTQGAIRAKLKKLGLHDQPQGKPVSQASESLQPTITATSSRPAPQPSVASASREPTTEAPAGSRQKSSTAGVNFGPWLAYEDKELITRFRAGGAVAELARYFNRPLWSVEARLKRHGISPNGAWIMHAAPSASSAGAVRESKSANDTRPHSHQSAGGVYAPWTEGEEKLLLSRYNIDMTIGQMAELHDRTEHAIRTKLNLLLQAAPTLRWVESGVSENREWSDSDNVFLRRARSLGWSATKIAHELARSPAEVSGRMTVLGL